MMLRVSKVKYLHDYILQIVFNDGKIKTVDLEDIVKKGGYYFEPLQDINRFKNVTMDDMNYSICWPNGADLSPDTLYEIGKEIEKKVKRIPSARRRSHITSSSHSKSRISAKSKH
jgi:hypothetical protein